MKAPHTDAGRLERRLATTLAYGTWLASAVIAAGLVLTPRERANGLALVSAGIVIFILLPVVRVVMMLTAFVRTREYLLAVVAGVVLAIISLGVLSGIHH